MEVTGEWEHRPSGNYWPWHWKATDYSVCEFETPRLIRKFLSELPSVGTELAARIIRLYPNANVIVEKYPEKLTVIMGIDKSKAFQIQKEFLQLKERRSLDSFLQKYGLKSEDISKISSHYGNNALALLRKNPYLLCMDGFASFKLCDKIGKDLGIAADAYCRLSCAMKVVLKSMAAAKGHTYLTEELLIEDSNEFFRENAVMECTFSKELLAERLRNLIAGGEIVYEEGRFYHPDRYQNEKDTADILLRRAGRPSRYENVDESIIDECLDLVQCEIGILLDSLQLEAVKSAIKNSTMVITGGPGSGKTTLLNTFIKTVEYMAQKIGMPNNRLPTLNRGYLECEFLDITEMYNATGIYVLNVRAEDKINGNRMFTSFVIYSTIGDKIREYYKKGRRIMVEYKIEKSKRELPDGRNEFYTNRVVERIS